MPESRRAVAIDYTTFNRGTVDEHDRVTANGTQFALVTRDAVTHQWEAVATMGSRSGEVIARRGSHHAVIDAAGDYAWNERIG